MWPNEAMELLRQRVHEAGSQIKFASKHNIDRGLLNRVLSGKKPMPPSIIEAIRTETTYEERTSQRRKLRRSKLHAVVHTALLNRSRDTTYLDIEKATGVQEGWISALARDKISDPSAIRLELLYEYLTGKTLEFEATG